MLVPANTSADAQATSSPADWTQFLRDNMQRWNPYETVLSINNVGSLKLKYETILRCQSSTSFTSSPAVVNGAVYFGCNNNVYAVNASTGETLWSYATGSTVQSSAAVAHGVVYIGSDDGNLYALNASTGVKLWTYSTNSFPYASPAAVNGVVYVGDGYTLYALNAKTGTLLWSFEEHGGFPLIELFSPAVANGVVYVGSDDGFLSALNASTGAVLWQYSTGNRVDAVPAVASGVVYFGSNNNARFYALDASTGALLWSYALINGALFSAPAVANGLVYVIDQSGNVYALNASTGVLLWSLATQFAVASSSPAVANGVLYFISGDGTLYGLSANTGAKLWSYAVGNDSSSPTIVDGVVYVHTENNSGSLFAFSVGADLFLRIKPSTTTVHQGDLLTFAFPVWNLGPGVAEGEVLSNLQVPAGTTFDYLRISGTPGLGTCTHPPYGGTGQIVCHEGDGMAPNTTWTVRLTVKVTAPAGAVITANAATMSDTPDPNMANNTASVSLKVQ